MNRFDFEQQLMSCWNVVEDIKTLNRQMLDVRNMSEDEISNYLLGLETIYNVKFEQLFAGFEDLVREGKL